MESSAYHLKKLDKKFKISLDPAFGDEDTLHCNENPIPASDEIKEMKYLFEAGVEFYKRKNYKLAINKFDKVIELAILKGNVRAVLVAAWYNKGVTHIKIVEYKDAMDCFNNAMKINPRYANACADAWYNEGYSLYYEVANFGGAIKAYDKAIELNPQCAEAYNSKGIALKALGQIADANVAFVKAKELGYKG